MQRTVASFALATLSLLVSYAIVAAWPDRPDEPLVAKMAPAELSAPAVPTVVGFVD